MKISNVNVVSKNGLKCDRLYRVDITYDNGEKSGAVYNEKDYKEALLYIALRKANVPKGILTLVEDVIHLAWNEGNDNALDDEGI